MNRIAINEISYRRFLNAIVRRVQDLPHAIAWKSSSSFSETNKSRLAKFRNIHAKQRCFIMGNGPSLGNMDLSLLKNEVTFGLNRIYLLFDKISFTPTYYVCVNELVLEQFAHEIAKLEMQKFLNWNRRSFFDFNDSTTSFIRVSLSLMDGFNDSVAKPFYSGGTVTYVAIQLASFMGFSEIYLIGVDHSFVDKGTPNETETRNSDVDENHFVPDYFPKGVMWQLPDLLRSEIAYSTAKKEMEKQGGCILDATVGGKLTVFEKVKFKDLF